MKAVVVSNAAHTLSYSLIALQEMNLAHNYPIIFWNTACLIVDSAGIVYDDDEDADEVSEQDNTQEQEEVENQDVEEWEGEVVSEENKQLEKKKKKIKTVDYGKVATAIGNFKKFGISIAPPDINSSSFTFTPVVETNTILYGLRGITRVSTDLVKTIMEQRPFNSLEDFLSRVKVDCVSMVNLIKCGAFDSVENKSREQIMDVYIAKISDHKDKVSLQNLAELFQLNIIPADFNKQKALFSFNKYLKASKQGNYYMPDEKAMTYLNRHGCVDLLEDGVRLPCKSWDKVYAKQMSPLRDYIKEHSDTIANELNQRYLKATKEKYAQGNISKWEMESLSFYSHPHELTYCKRIFDDFFKMPEESIIEKTFTTKDGREIPIYRLYSIGGTVIDKNKLKNTITLLAKEGVVTIRVPKSMFATYDRQISFVKKDGKKVVAEKSWFSRGTLLIVQGYRRGQDFVPKAYKNSSLPAFSRIDNVTSSGHAEIQYERLEVEDEM